MSYEAFPSGATVYPASAFSAPSHPHPKPAAILQADDSALDWLQRDAASPNAPAALKTLQGCRSLLSMISGGGGGAHSGSAAAAAAAAVAATPAELSTGDVCELFGRSGSGKTEMLYSCIATNILPKTLCSSVLGCTLSLGGFDGGALVLDLDYRFNVGRLLAVLQGAITKAFEAHALKRTDRHVATAAAAAATPLPPGTPAFASAVLSAQAQLSAFFDGAEWVALRTHLLSCVFLFRAQSPRAVLATLRQMDACCDSFSRGRPKTWEAKQQQQRLAQQLQQQQQDRRNTQSQQDGDEEMKGDANDPSYNPRLPRGVAAAASAASAARASSASVARISLVCVDGAASFQWLIKGQGPGYAGMASGMRSAERVAIGAGAYNPAPSGRVSTDSWFYELFAEGLKSLMQRRALIGIVTKTTPSKKAADVLDASFEHNETLGPAWNSLMRFRISLRTPQSFDPSSFAARDGSSAAATVGVREVHLKDIAQAAKNPDGHAGTSRFRINITQDGIRFA